MAERPSLARPRQKQVTESEEVRIMQLMYKYREICGFYAYF